MPNFETHLAWECHAEFFEYYAAECPADWLKLSKEYFTEEHGAVECEKIDWVFISDKLSPVIAYSMEENR